MATTFGNGATTPASSPTMLTPSSYYNGFTNATFNPAMAIIIIVLISSFFVIGFISVFLRRCRMGEAEGEGPRAGGGPRPANSNTKARGLDRATVDALPVLHNKDLGEKEDRECPVCLTEFEPDDALRLLPKCNHVFHLECIDVWFNSHSTCPLCRASLSPPGEKDSIPTSDGASAAEGGDGGAAPPANVRPLVGDDRGADDGRAGDSEGARGGGGLLHSHTGVPLEGGSAAGPLITREDERDSARLALFRNSQSFKRAVRGVAAHERAAAGPPFPADKPSGSLNPIPPAPPIRRSSSLGTDLKSLRDYFFVNGEGAQAANGNFPSPSKQVASSDFITRTESMGVAGGKGAQRNGIPSVRPQDHWVTIDLGEDDASGAGPSSKGGEAPLSPGGRIERVWSERWSFSNLRGVVLNPLRRTASDLLLPTRSTPT